MFHVTFFSNSFDTSGQQAELATFEDVVTQIAKRQPDVISSERKLERSAFAGGRFLDGSRRAAAFEGTRLLSLDVDGPGHASLSDEDVERTIGWLEGTGLCFAAYSTWREGLRVIIPISALISDGEAFRELYRRVASWMPVPADIAAAGIARLNYLPSQQPGARDVRVWARTDGRLLDPSADFTAANPGFVAPERDARGGGGGGGGNFGVPVRNLAEFRARLARSTSKQSDLWWGSSCLAEAAAARGEDRDVCFRELLEAADAALEENARNGVSEPVRDPDLAIATVERAVRSAFEAYTARTAEDQTPDEETPDEKTEAEKLIDRLLRKAQAEFKAPVCLIPEEPDYEALGAVSGLLKDGRITLAARILASHGWAGSDAADKLADRLTKHKIDAADFASKVDAARDRHSGPPLPFSDFDLARFMSDYNEHVQPTWLYADNKTRWFSKQSAGWKQTSAGIVWSEAAQLGDRLDLRRQVDESTLLSAAFRPSFECQHVSTMFDLVPGQRFSYNENERVLSECVSPRRKIEPRRSEAFERWVRETFVCSAADRHAFDLWLAAVSDLTQPLPSLLLYGPTQTGKSLFASAIARLWDEFGTLATAAAYMGTLGGQGFNAGLVGLPIAFADEDMPCPPGESYVDVDTWKERVTAYAVTITKKGQDPYTLYGSNRLIIAINESYKLHLSPTVRNDQKTLEALGNRVLVLTVKALDPNPEVAAQKFLDIGLDFQSDEIAAHCLWLSEQHRAEIESRRTRQLRCLNLGNAYPFLREWSAEAASDGRTRDAVVKCIEQCTQLMADTRMPGISVQGRDIYVTALGLQYVRAGGGSLKTIVNELLLLTGEPAPTKREQRICHGQKLRASWYRISAEIAEKLGCEPPGADESRSKTTVGAN